MPIFQIESSLERSKPGGAKARLKTFKKDKTKMYEEAGKVVAQILAVVIFLAMFVLIVLEVWERHIITLGCGLLTLVLVFGLGMHSMSAVLETLNLGSFFTSHFW